LTDAKGIVVAYVGDPVELGGGFTADNTRLAWGEFTVLLPPSITSPSPLTPSPTPSPSSSTKRSPEVGKKVCDPARSARAACRSLGRVDGQRDDRLGRHAPRPPGRPDGKPRRLRPPDRLLRNVRQMGENRWQVSWSASRGPSSGKPGLYLYTGEAEIATWAE
jgi:hypothetical protein